LKVHQGETELALAAYNAGPERVKQWLKRYPIKNRLLFLDFLPIRETREYVSSITRNYYWYLKIYGENGEVNKVRGPAQVSLFPHIQEGFIQTLKE
jgi:soluble lytic murein transglycosylase